MSLKVKCYVDPQMRGVVRFHDGCDAMDGLMAGSRAASVALAINERDALLSIADATDRLFEAEAEYGHSSARLAPYRRDVVKSLKELTKLRQLLKGN